MATAHVYKRDHINTDEIIPARHLNTDDAAELAKHCMEDLDVNFVRKCKPGDVIVASVDFGCGSSGEHAVRALMHTSGAVIADTRCISTAPHQLRLRPIEPENAVEKISDGDEAEIDYEKGVIDNKTQGSRSDSSPARFRQNTKDGGLLNIRKAWIAAKW